MPDYRKLAHLSPSRLTAYQRCPELFRQRYVEKLAQPPSWERDFGSAVHKGIEAHYRQEDHEMAFLTTWRRAVRECNAANMAVPPWLSERGLELIEAVRNMQLEGDPECYIGTLVSGVSVPIIGYVDLWCPGNIYDFKTTGFAWSQKRADAEVFQPAIYSHAYAEAHEGELPRFTYIVLPRNGGPVVKLDGSRDYRQITEAFEQVRQIHTRIEAEDWACTCSGKFCGLETAA